MRVPGDVPHARTSFVGRETELRRICDSPGEVRLLTVTGLGGTGKTRLAYEAAARLASNFDDVRSVELAPVAGPEGVRGAFALAIGERARTPAEAIGGRRLLLVVDNCEHVVSAVADVLDELLENCPNLFVLATSREPIRVPGEHVLVLGTLSLVDAVALFRDRAAAAGTERDLDPGPEDAEAATRICRRVDCIPLAVELAAAQTSFLPPTELAELIEQRIDVLAGTERGVPLRHRTLRGLLDWSFQLLDEREIQAFLTLAVFPTGASLAAAESVCGPVSVLCSLADKGLVMAVSPGPAPRLRILHTVREYALAKLVESAGAAAAYESHASWYVDWAESALRRHIDDDPVDWLPEVRREQSEAVAAIRHLLTSDRSADALVVGAATWRIWEVQGRFSEGRRLLDEILAAAPVSADEHRATVLQASGGLAFAAGDHRAAERLQRSAVETHQAAGRTGAAALAMNSLGITLLFRGDAEEAHRVCGMALSDLQREGDERGTAFARSSLGIIAARSGGYDVALAHLLESLAILRRLGRRRDAAAVLVNLGSLADDRGDLVRAHRFYDGALQLHLETGDMRGEALCLNNLSLVACRRGDLERATAYAEEARTRFDAIEDRQGVAAILHNLANFAAERGDAEVAAALYLDSLSAYKVLGDGGGEAMVHEHLASLLRAEGRDDNAWEHLLVAAVLYRGLSLGEPLKRTLAVLARIAEAHGQVDLASRLRDGHLDDGLAAPRPSPPAVSRSSVTDVPASVLSTREAEVADLVGQGLANHAIAERLFVSERTVNSHIAHIRTKLDIRSRTQLALWAAARRDRPPASTTG